LDELHASFGNALVAPEMMRAIAVGKKLVQFGRFPKFVDGLAEFLFRPAKEKGIYQSDKECRDFLIPCTNYGFKCYIHIFLIYSLDSHL
jgi:hypothetical protein